MKNTEEKLIPNIVKEINDKFGKEVIFYQNTTGDVVSTLDSGSLLLNHISGGGYPIGRLVEIYGPESAGKTTLTITAIKHCTGEKMIAFLDIERSFD
jgi:recombination protein RecA